MKSDGTEIFITHLRNPNQTLINNEMCCSEDGGDIIVRSEVLQDLGLPSAPDLFENSLSSAVDWMYVQHPPHLKLEINGKVHRPKNPCSRIYLEQEPEAFSQG